MVGLKIKVMGRLDKLQITKALINEMFKIAGHDVKYEDIVGRKDEWYYEWTMTEEQNKQWREWGAKFIKHHMNVLKTQAESEMAMFDLNYGLKVKE
jgi:hypothetical protein